VQAKSARLQPHIQAFVADWPLVEGCIRLLTACHEALVAAPGWQESLPYGQACDWGGKHEALVVDWALAWPHLLAHAEAAGRQQEALALLALAASTTLSGEAQLLASMLLQLPQRQRAREAVLFRDRALEHKRLQFGPRGVNGGRPTCRPAADDNNLFCHNYSLTIKILSQRRGDAENSNLNHEVATNTKKRKV